jgi:hypothetical protein
MIAGFLGMRYAKRHRQAAGRGHAIIGMVLGMLSTLIGLLLLIGLAVFTLGK